MASRTTGVSTSKGLIAHKFETGSVVGFTGGERTDNKEVLEFDCDVLVPAALEKVITRENAPRIRAKIVAEAANGPTLPEADDILFERGIMVLPDILANAGGVTVSYFEWVQDLQANFWEEDEINEASQTQDDARVPRDARTGKAPRRFDAQRERIASR